jgi:hypothetical protein
MFDALARVLLVTAMLAMFVTTEPVAAWESIVQSQKLLGAWKAVSYELHLADTGEVQKPLGDKPMGYMMFTESRMVMLLENGVRQPAADRLPLFFFTGPYRVEGRTMTVTVDAGVQRWIGTEQAREYSVSGKHLKITTPPMQAMQVNPALAPDRMASIVVVFERE